MLGKADHEALGQYEWWRKSPSQSFVGSTKRQKVVLIDRLFVITDTAVGLFEEDRPVSGGIWKGWTIE